MEITNGYVLLAIFTCFVALTIFALRKKKRLEQQSVRQIQAEYGADVLLSDEKAMYYGLASKGALQTHEQGGIFVITPSLVRFRSWDYGGKSFGAQVNFDFAIPLERLEAFGTARKVEALGPLGSFGGDGLLVLRFVDEGGTSDELALWVKQKQPEALAQLEKLTGQTAFQR